MNSHEEIQSRELRGCKGAVWDNYLVLLEETDETALIQAIRSLEPIVIVDESHYPHPTLVWRRCETLTQASFWI